MELYLNELSVSSPTASVAEAKGRIVTFLKTARALKAHGFNLVRTHDHFYVEDFGGGYTASNFLTDGTNDLTLRTLLQSIVKNPFIPDSDSYEAEVFISNKFETKAKNGAEIKPEGLAAAYIFDSHSISFCGHIHWEREAIPVNMTNLQGEIFTREILNHAFETCTDNPVFKAWQKLLKDEIPLDSLTNIQSVFPPTQFHFEQRAIDDIISWYYDDVRFQIRIKKLIEDILKNPFSGGLGHTETLAGTGGKASKRIIGKDRIVYTYTIEKIIIYQCKGHYEDH